MRQVSKKRARALRERKKLTDAMKREGYVRCQFPVTITGKNVDHGVETDYRLDGTCPWRADDLHEIVSRARGGSITDPANVMPLCREHHRWVTEHPKEAEAMGLSGRQK